MKVELRSNGTIRIHLKAETLIEAAYLKELLAGAEKGRTITLQEDIAVIDDMPHAALVMEK